VSPDWGRDAGAKESDGVSSMIMLCYVRLQLTAGNLPRGLNDISGHVGESHMSGNCS